MGYLLAKPARYFREKRLSSKRRKAKLKVERQKQFRKGFMHKGSEPKSFDVKPQLPTRGKSKRAFIRRRARRFF